MHAYAHCTHTRDVTKREHIHACIHTYIHARLIMVYFVSVRFLCIHTYIHTYAAHIPGMLVTKREHIHTCMHAYIHTYAAHIPEMLVTKREHIHTCMHAIHTPHTYQGCW